MVIAATEFKTSDYPMVARSRAMSALERSSSLGSEWKALIAGNLADALEQRRALLDPDDPINIQYTSGTTGFPKGATLSHHNILNNGLLHRRGAASYTERDRVCIPVPFYHCFGMVIGNLALRDARRDDRDSLRGLRPARRLEAVERGAVHVALRGADDVHRRARAPELRGVRPLDCAPASWPAHPARSR